MSETKPPGEIYDQEWEWISSRTKMCRNIQQQLHEETMSAELAMNQILLILMEACKLTTEVITKTLLNNVQESRPQWHNDVNLIQDEWKKPKKTTVARCNQHNSKQSSKIYTTNYYFPIDSVDNDEIETAILDTGATATALRSDAPTKATGKQSNKIFQAALGTTQAATKEVQLNLNLRRAATIGHEVPTLTSNLLSVSKLADANYTTVFSKDRVEIFDNQTTKLSVTNEAALKGYRCKQTGLWRIPLVENITNENLHTLLIQCPQKSEAIHNVYELPTTEQTIKYLHAAAGFPTKKTWIEAINRNAYASWPGLTAKAVRKYFPESDETMKGHSKGQRQNVRSTKANTSNSENDNKDQENSTEAYSSYHSGV